MQYGSQESDSGLAQVPAAEGALCQPLGEPASVPVGRGVVPGPKRVRSAETLVIEDSDEIYRP